MCVFCFGALVSCVASVSLCTVCTLAGFGIYLCVQVICVDRIRIYIWLRNPTYTTTGRVYRTLQIRRAFAIYMRRRVLNSQFYSMM